MRSPVTNDNLEKVKSNTNCHIIVDVFNVEGFEDEWQGISRWSINVVIAVEIVEVIARIVGRIDDSRRTDEGGVTAFCIN